MKKTAPVRTPAFTASLLPLIALTTLLTSAEPSRSAPFVPGEILVGEFGSSSVQRYSAAGVLLQTFTGTGTNWEGASLTPDGNLVTAYSTGNASPIGINIFAPGGTQIMSFVATGNSFRGDVSVFANGTIALNNQGNNTVQFWSQAGILLKTVSLPGISDPFGSTVGSDGILYVADFLSNHLARVSAGGVSLGNVNLSFSPGDLVMNPQDGTLWVSGYSNGLVEHITTNGTVLGSFATGLVLPKFEGIGLAPDGNSLYVTSQNSTVVKHFDLSGNQLGSFALSNPSTPAFLTVVPSGVGLGTPEPGSAALLVGGCALLAARRGRRTV